MRDAAWTLRRLPSGYCPVNCSDAARKIAGIFHRQLRGDLAGHDGGHFAGCYAAIARFVALTSGKGMVSNQNTGFPIPESRQRFRSFERHKIGAPM
jgi:hypothetical protein